MQYYILFKIFRNASFTILGDVNQTINPYYKYDSLNVIKEMLPSSCYLELLKTYRSSEEIIDYTNKILDLNFVSAIRRGKTREVVRKSSSSNFCSDIVDDIISLQREYKSVAVITKTDKETLKLYDLIKEYVPITMMNQYSEEYKRNLVILPSYIAKGLEFDAVIIYTDCDNFYTVEEKYLFYVACTRAQHQLIVYNQNI